MHVSPFPFLETMDRLQALIADRGLRLFDIIDHEAAAAAVGLELRPTRVLVFGNPAGGTPLMHEWPALALELPLRIAVWQGDDQRVRTGPPRPRTPSSPSSSSTPSGSPPSGVPADIIAHLLAGV